MPKSLITQATERNSLPAPHTLKDAGAKGPNQGQRFTFRTHILSHRSP